MEVYIMNLKKVGVEGWGFKLNFWVSFCINILCMLLFLLFWLIIYCVIKN